MAWIDVAGPNALVANASQYCECDGAPASIRVHARERSCHGAAYGCDAPRSTRVIPGTAGQPSSKRCAAPRHRPRASRARRSNWPLEVGSEWPRLAEDVSCHQSARRLLGHPAVAPHRAGHGTGKRTQTPAARSALSTLFGNRGPWSSSLRATSDGRSTLTEVVARA